MTSAPAIGFEYRPSCWMPRLLGMVGVLAILSLWLSGLPLAIRIVVMCLLPWVYWRARRAWLESKVLAAGWARDGHWSLRVRDGQDVAAELVSFRVMGQGIVWLRLSLPARRHTVLLLAPDNSDADIRRRLRMRLAQLPAPGTPAAERGPTVSARLGR